MMGIFLVLIVLVLGCVETEAVFRWYNTSSQPIENDKNIVNVHITPHTHDDTGWLKTVDEYYFTQVQFILDTVVDSLQKNPDRVFNYVEMAFFSRWWEDQSDATKTIVRGLVKKGQLEFLNGGWCMHDEASPFFSEMVDQTTRGHQFIVNEFGADASPRATWQVDPFGHSNTQAWLLGAEAGMPSQFWFRWNEDDRAQREKTKRMEYVWRGSASRGAKAEIFGSGLWGEHGEGVYKCPVFDFEQYDRFVSDDPRKHGYNIDEWVDKVEAAALEQASQYKTPNILWACGMDFNWKNAEMWYTNIDKVIHHVNKRGRVNLFYSTPARYVDAVNRVKDARWEVREDDLMNLKERAHDYWTGYFSSRVPFKRLVRHSHGFLEAARQVEWFSDYFGVSWNRSEDETGHVPPVVGDSWTDSLEAALAVSSHHDGVSGTAQQAVNNDYAQRISEGLDTAERGVDRGLNLLTGLPGWTRCRHLNISLCELTASSDSFGIALWNSRSREMKAHTIAVPVSLAPDSETFVVETANGSAVPVQIAPLDDITKSLPLLYLNRFGLDKDAEKAQLEKLANKASHLLTLQADLAPAGVTVLHARKEKKNNSHNGTKITDVTKTTVACSSFQNEKYRVNLDPKTQAVTEIVNLETGVSTKLHLDWGYYQSAPPIPSMVGSGAYVFRPKSSTFYPTSNDGLKTQVYEGPVATEIRQQVSNWVSHIVRLKKGAPYVEIEYTVGPVPIGDNIGKELSLRYSTGINSQGVFFTDSNGLEMQRRERNKRPASYPQPFDADEPIASNYYPVNSMISIRDDKAQFGVITDSTQGGSSINDGQVELMVIRRILCDDYKGVEEPLNETMCGCNGLVSRNQFCYCSGIAVRGIHRIVLDEPTAAIAQQRQINLDTQLEPAILFSSANSELEQRRAVVETPTTILASSLPSNVHLLTFSNNYAKRNGGATLVRLQHIYATDEHPVLSQPVTIDLGNLFRAGIRKIKEMTLTANKPIKEKFTLKWNYEKQEDGDLDWQHSSCLGRSNSVTLFPMQICTFWITFKEHHTIEQDILIELNIK